MITRRTERCWGMAPSFNVGPTADCGPDYCACCDCEPCCNTTPCSPERVTGYCKAPAEGGN